jgi:hypothetical protein
MAERKMTEKEFAVEVGVSERTARRERQARRSQHHRVGWKIYYLQEDVDAWHEANKHEPICRKSDLRKVS